MEDRRTTAKSTESLDTPPTCNTPEVHKAHRHHRRTNTCRSWWVVCSSATWCCGGGPKMRVAKVGDLWTGDKPGWVGGT